MRPGTTFARYYRQRNNKHARRAGHEKRLLPFPLLPPGRFTLWLLLNQALTWGHIVLAGAAALAGGWALTELQPPRARVRRLGTILHLSSLVLADIVRSNIAVSRIILGLARRERRSLSLSSCSAER